MKTTRNTPAASSALAPIVVVAGVAIVAGSFGWRLFTRPEPSHHTEIVDMSGSRIKNCAEVDAVTHGLLSLPSSVPGSTITVLATGDADRDFEPNPIAKETIPFAAANPYGVSGEEDKGTTAIRQHITDACKQMRETSRSPIRRAVERAVEQAQAIGCGGKRDCQIIVISDLLENVDRMKGKAVKPIPNKGVAAVTFCGYSNRLGGGSNSADLNGIKAEWTANLVDPPSFVPFCDDSIGHRATTR